MHLVAVFVHLNGVSVRIAEVCVQTVVIVVNLSKMLGDPTRFPLDCTRIWLRLTRFALA